MTRTISIRPTVGVFALFSAVDYKAWYALAEFVDNSIQSFLDTHEVIGTSEGRPASLTVRIDTEAGPAGTGISIKDNAGGIPSDRIAAAFQVATPPPDQSGLSVYGIGMKSAAAWFGDEFTFVTSAINEDVVRTVRFDFPTIIADRQDELLVSENPAAPGDHFSTLTIDRLHHPIRGATHDKVRRHLASIYRSYLRSGRIAIVYNGEALGFREPEVLRAPYFQDSSGAPVEWHKEIDVTLDTGERIHGFAALRKTADTKSPGFALFRRDRVITGIEDDPWRPMEIFGAPNKFAAQRLFGELQLENVKVSYSKNGFVWQAAEEEIISVLRTALDSEPIPLLRQANGYRARQAEEAEQQAATQALERTADALEACAGSVIAAELEHELAPEPNEVLVEAPLVRQRTVRLAVDNTTWTVSCELTNDDGDADWLEIADEMMPEHRLQIRINLAHPFSRRFAANDSDDLEAMLRIAASLALAITVARMQGARHVGAVLRVLNKLLEATVN